MSLVIAVAALVAATLLYTLFVRPNDIPAPDPVSPTRHLEERRAAIYENLRDLQFEYRVGKLSDTDYQQTKLALQKELAAVIGEIQQVVSAMGTAPAAAKPVATSATVMAASGAIRAAAKGAFVCPHCGADFPVALKFCGECGKEMQ
jgi:rRNA maturation endonuclease Nob1